MTNGPGLIGAVSLLTPNNSFLPLRVHLPILSARNTFWGHNLSIDDDNHFPDADGTESTSDPSARAGIVPGHLIGTFRIEATISSGGMGTVFRAYDESMKRPVALKVLHPSFAISQSAHQRFAREAWIAGQLEHPGIIRVYTRGEDSGLQYFAMELADGGSLADFIKQQRSETLAGTGAGQTVRNEQIRWVLEKCVSLARALDYVHEHGFVHRDIKPHNILLSGPDRLFRLSDFGIAHASDMTKVTRAGDFIGTIKYMSPELLTAHRATVDKRTDIYSLGVTLYEALTLTLPFDGDTEERYVTEILAGRAIPARRRNQRISRDLETVLMTAMHQDPARRYQSASAFADDLQAVLDGRPIRAKRESAAMRAYKFSKRHATRIAFVALPTIVAGLVLWGWYAREKADMDYQRIVQTLQTVIASRQSADQVAADWPRLAPTLADLIRTNPTDSAVRLYYRSRILLGTSAEDFGRTKNYFQLVLHGASVPLPHLQINDPILLARATISMGLDSTNLQTILIGESSYTVDGDNLGFIAAVHLDSLFAGLSGQQYLQMRVISQHYRNAQFFEPTSRYRQRNETSPHDSLPEPVVITRTGDTLVPSLSINSSSLYWKSSPITTVLNLSDHLPGPPVFTDTVMKTFDIFIPANP